MATEPVLNKEIVLERVIGNREAIAFQLLDMDGTAIDVTSLTIVFRMVRITSGKVIINNQTATKDSAASGKVSYVPAAADVADAGEYACYFLDTTTTPNKRYPYDGAKFVLRLKKETEV